jgi:uncharacterized protein YndB with AHSA1/START domain
MKILNYFAVVALSLLAVYVIGGFLLPTAWSISKNTTIKAPAEKVYEQIANLRNWQNWAPWNKDMDRTQVYTYEGPESGVGAKWLWTSEKMGKGWLEITEADPEKGISYRLFIDMDNRQSTINGAINYTKTEDHLNVVWSDQGVVGDNFNERWMTLLIKFMLGKEMSAGLEKLKLITEH